MKCGHERAWLRSGGVGGYVREGVTGQGTTKRGGGGEGGVVSVIYLANGEELSRTKKILIFLLAPHPSGGRHSPPSRQVHMGRERETDGEKRERWGKWWAGEGWLC